MKRPWEVQRFLFEEASGDEGDGGTGSGGGGNEDKGKRSDPTKITINGETIDIARAASALSLYKALEDPDTATEIVETLARKAGLLDRQDNTTVGEEKTKKVMEGLITKTLKSKLGKDYDKFSDLVGPALQEAMESMLADKFGEQEANNSKNTWDSHVNKFVESHTLTSDIEDKMKELMEEAPPNTAGKNFNAQKYLTRMYNNAISELEIDPPEEPEPVRSKRGRQTEVPDMVVRPAPKNVDLDTAIEAAVKGIRFRR